MWGQNWVSTDCALQANMVGTVGESTNLDAEYFCWYCDSKSNFVSYVVKLLNICTYVASRANIEKNLNVSICVLRGSQKRRGKDLLHLMESIKEKV